MPADFDFDQWAALARSDPVAFERARAQAVAEVIARAPERLQHRLSGLQWRLDQERRLAGNPLAACMRMYGGMWDAVTGPDGLLAHLHGLAGAEASGGSAAILPFRSASGAPEPDGPPLPRSPGEG